MSNEEFQLIIASKDKEIEKLQMLLDEVSASNNLEECNNIERQNTIVKLATYLKEAITIMTSFGLHDVHKCGRTYNACKHCMHFNHKINHATCSDEELFVWANHDEAVQLIAQLEQDKII